MRSQHAFGPDTVCDVSPRSESSKWQREKGRDYFRTSEQKNELEHVQPRLSASCGALVCVCRCVCVGYTLP